MSKVSSKKAQEKIGYLIKTLRTQRGLTQKEFAKLLKTSQSAVARMENGGQNFTTAELLKISNVLDRRLISLKDTVDFSVNGGKKLKGSITTNTSKNGAMGLIAASLLNEGKTTLHQIPRIQEVYRIIEVLESIGVSVKWKDQNTLVIQTPDKIKVNEMDKEAGGRTRSVIMLIGSLIHLVKSFNIPHAGGCKMGQRTIAAHRYGLEELGVEIDTKETHYEIKDGGLHGGEVIMYEAGDTAVINVLLAAAKIEEETTISFASSNYQVQEVCFFLEDLGVEIDGIGTSTLKIRGKKKIKQDIEYYNSEDPIESMMFITAAIITDSTLSIKRCPIDFLNLELYKLSKMGLQYDKSGIYKAKNGRTKLVDVKIKPSKLSAPSDKLHALPYPGINVDNLPFFVTIALKCEGTTLIHDWMWENRAIYFTELNRFGAQVNLADPHRVYVSGPADLRPTQVVSPPALRPAMIILLAMLAAKGESVLRNVYTIERGYESVAERLNKIGADIEVIKGV
jgi:UDP-N-acetylglucosamine 1-carboxyvinyltransferase